MVEDNIIIHIGLSKTASTFFRYNFFPKLEGVHYTNATLYVAKIVPYKINLISQPSLTGNMFKSKSDLRCSRYETMKRVATIFPNARIILVLRDEESIKKSIYSQHLRRDGNLSYDDFIDKEFNKDYTDYELLIYTLDKLFPLGVYVCHLEDMGKDFDKFVANMCSFIGCPIPMVKNKKRNVGFNKNMLKFNRLFNKYVLGGRWLLYKHLNQVVNQDKESLSKTKFGEDY